MKRILSLFLSFVMVFGIINITPIINVNADALPTDISTLPWAADAIQDVITKKIMPCTTDEKGNLIFNPTANATRADFADALFNCLGLTADGTKTFTDTADNWAKNKISKLADLGLMKGVSETEFGPNDPITREQIATILFRALKLKESQSNFAYQDDGQISDWAKQSVYAVYAAGWMKGDDSGTFRPQDTANRAEVAVIFSRLSKENIKNPTGSNPTPTPTPAPTSTDNTTTLMSNNYTVIKDSINGYENMTVQEVKKGAITNAGSSLEMLNADGTVASDETKAVKGMHLRVTAPDGKTTANYLLKDSAHQIGEISYTVNGLNADGTFSDGKINATVIVDSYVDGLAKNYTLTVAQYKNNSDQTAGSKTASASISTKGTTTLTVNYDVVSASKTSFKIFLQDDSSKTVLKSYYLDTHLAGKTLYNFGDSITGMGMRSYSENLQKNTGMQTVNVGISGAKMAKKGDAVDCLSMAEIVKGLTTPNYNWEAQDKYVESQKSQAMTDHLSNLKALNIKKAGYITVFYGTNDFSANVPLDNADNPTDSSTFGGSIRYIVNTLIAANPNMKIMFLTPMYRDRQSKKSDNPYVADGKNSDDFANGKGVYLKAYGDKIKEIAENYKNNVVVLDLYQDSGINKYNHEKYFYDGLHPNSSPDSPGNILLGDKISDALIKNF